MSVGTLILIVSLALMGLAAVKVWWLMGYIKKQAEQEKKDEDTTNSD